MIDSLNYLFWEGFKQLQSLVIEIDLNYLQWLAWVTYPLLISFFLPLVVLILLYISAILLQLYCIRKLFLDAITDNFWDGGRKIVAALWYAHGRLWHGYEVSGLENIPTQGPALLIFYHGALPVDVYYLIAKVFLFKKRMAAAVGDRFLFKIPGFKLLLEVIHVYPGSINSCVDLLNQGHLLVISPGGVREALFGDEYYKIIWAQRKGFARVAIDAKVPIIPIFTQNCREAFRSVGFLRGFLKHLYEKTRLPLIPIYGGFPVKLKTHIGKPIAFDSAPNESALTLKVKAAIEELISKHQQIPGSIFRALLQRIYMKKLV